LLIVFVFFVISTHGGFLAKSNLSNLVEQCFTVAVVAVGASFIYASGSMDISVGAVMALAELVLAYMMNSGRSYPIPVLLLAAICVSVICMLINGVVSTYLRVPAMVVSLCMMNVCTGIVTTAVAKKDLYVPYFDYSFLNSSLIKGSILLLIIAAGWILFHKTRIGRSLKAAGGNSVAAEESGIDCRKTIVLGFLILGICLGIAAFFSLVRVGVVTGSTGGGLGLNILVAIVLGGFPLTGGAKSRMIGAVVGAFTVTTLSNGMALLNIDTNIAALVKGVLFLTIVAISYDKSNGRIVS
jgi:ribose transport system permease protein